jgi:hypothetical protein
LYNREEAEVHPVFFDTDNLLIPPVFKEADSALKSGITAVHFFSALADSPLCYGVTNLWGPAFQIMGAVSMYGFPPHLASFFMEFFTLASTRGSYEPEVFTDTLEYMAIRDRDLLGDDELEQGQTAAFLDFVQILKEDGIRIPCPAVSFFRGSGKLISSLAAARSLSPEHRITVRLANKWVAGWRRWTQFENTSVFPWTAVSIILPDDKYLTDFLSLNVQDDFPNGILLQHAALDHVFSVSRIRVGKFGGPHS